MLFTTCASADARTLQAWGRANGATELMIPRDIRVLKELPVLGTGKVDYVMLGEWALTASSSNDAAEGEGDED